MKKFKYYHNADPHQESLGMVSAHNWENAVHLAAERKRLDTEKFLRIFSIQEIKKDNEKPI